MTHGQGEPTPLHCPRCGGLMRKAAGSTLYWHADNNHPRCNITNIVATILEVQEQEQPVEPPPPSPSPPKPRNRRSK